MDREVRRLRDGLARKFADVCYNGFWYSPENEFLLHAMKKAQDVSNTTGKLLLVVNYLFIFFVDS